MKPELTFNPMGSCQGAPRNGAMLFEVTTPGGCTTHAGLLDFTAAEGFIALPRKVSELCKVHVMMCNDVW